MDKGVADGNLSLLTLHSDGNGLFCSLQIGIHPHTEGDKALVQSRGVLQLKFDA